MVHGKYYSLMIVPDGTENPVGIRIRAWLLKTLVVLVALFIVGLIVFFSFYSKIISLAATAESLKKENEALKRYEYKVTLLAEKMKEAREVVTRISQLAGVDFEFPELPPDSVIFAELDNPKPAIMTRFASANSRRPQGLPLQGYMTRGFSDDSSDFHPGVDIAAAIGTPVLATAAGKVVYTDNDSIYGLIVAIEHDSGVSTLYGHNSELLVREGDEVLAGSRIALSGNTGKSTAPHLHYEIREDNLPVNPLKYIGEYEESSK
jgi:murein DD-endopeptidase MepM/ murein hydrolase activator NlpD